MAVAFIGFGCNLHQSGSLLVDGGSLALCRGQQAVYVLDQLVSALWSAGYLQCITGSSSVVYISAVVYVTMFHSTTYCELGGLVKPKSKYSLTERALIYLGS